MKLATLADTPEYKRRLDQAEEEYAQKRAEYLAAKAELYAAHERLVKVQSEGYRPV